MQYAYPAATICLFGGMVITVFLDICVHQISGHPHNCQTHDAGHSHGNLDLDRPFGNTESDDEGLNFVTGKNYDEIIDNVGSQSSKEKYNIDK